MKKKVIALVIDTLLSNEEIEAGEVVLEISDPAPGTRGHRPPGVRIKARNIKVLDSVDWTPIGKKVQ